MNVTLRKAHALQNNIQDSIKTIKVSFELDLNEFQDVKTELKKANDELVSNDTRRQKLLMALYNIRGLIGQANTDSGINLKLTTSAFIDKRISQLEEFNKAGPMSDLAVINGKLEKIRNRKEDRVGFYDRYDTIATSVVTTDQIEQAKTEIKNLKKQKQKLNDEILELNITTEIPLSEEVVATLQSEGLI